MPTFFVKRDVKDVLETVHYCLYCTSNENLSIDHIIPRIKGGNSELKNLTKACRKCNSTKGDLMIDEFLLRLLNKRSIVLEKTLLYLFQLKKYKRRNTQPEHRQWLIEKINAGRITHSYYTRIINSIYSGNYKIT